MEIEKIECSVCGRDTERFRMYDRNANVYCYECWYERKAKRKKLSEERKIADLYSKGMKVSQIARMFDKPAKEVYEVLTRYEKKVKRGVNKQRKND